MSLCTAMCRAAVRPGEPAELTCYIRPDPRRGHALLGTLVTHQSRFVSVFLFFLVGGNRLVVDNTHRYVFTLSC